MSLTLYEGVLRLKMATQTKNAFIVYTCMLKLSLLSVNSGQILSGIFIQCLCKTTFYIFI